MRGKIGLVSRFNPFNPASVATLTFWLDASDSATMFDSTAGGSLVSADGEVARLEEKVSARHFTQDTISARPIRKTAVRNGLDVLRFDGTADFMEHALASPYLSSLISSDNSTVFVAAKAAAINTDDADVKANAAVLADGATNHAWSAFRGATAYSTGAQNVGGRKTVSSSYTAGEWKVFTTRHEWGVIGLRLNGGSEATEELYTRGGMSPGFLKLGANYDASVCFEGDLGEVLIYNVALSAGNREAVESYLMTKWAIT